MTLNLYVIRDEAASDNSILLTEKNDDLLYRSIKVVMCSNQPNYINQHTQDKRVVLVGKLDTDTGVITPEVSPVLLRTLEDIRIELNQEITRAKIQAINDFVRNGVSKEDVEKFLNLHDSLLNLGYESNIFIKLKKENDDLKNIINEMEAKING